MHSSIWHEILALDAQYNTCRFPDKREPFYRTLYLRRRSQLLREYGLEFSAKLTERNTICSNESEESSEERNPKNSDQREGFQSNYPFPNNFTNSDKLRREYLHLRRQLLASRYGAIPSYPSSNTPELLSRHSRSRTGSIRSLFHGHSMDTADLAEGTSDTATDQSFPRSLSFVGSTSEMTSTASVVGSNRFSSTTSVVPTRRADASRALAGNTSISENYAFAGIKHIFDHHSPVAVTRICFPHNDPTRLAMASADGSLSVCRTWPSQEECVLTVMRGHRGTITDIDWTTANDFIVTVSRDRTACLWNVEQAFCTRSYAPREVGAGELLACQLQPMNNNILAVGGSGGVVQMLNMSTGKAIKTGRDKMPGAITALTFEEALGECLWVGTSQGLIQSYKCEPSTGRITRARRLNVSTSGACPVTSLVCRSWISREARDPCLLCNLGLSTSFSFIRSSTPSTTGLLLLRVVSPDGQLILKKRFPLRSSRHPVRSCFFPLISFRQGACVVSGSDDTRVHMFDIGPDHLPVKGLTSLLGHGACVLDVAVSCDESVMASADATGTVIIWRRGKEEDSDAMNKVNSSSSVLSLADDNFHEEEEEEEERENTLESCSNLV